MSTHWSAIGFPGKSADVYRAYKDLGHQRGTRLETPQGTYIHWQCGAGVEIWFQHYDQNKISMNPHFAGETRLQARLTEQFQRPDDKPLDGAFYGHATVRYTDDDPFYVPLLFDAPDYFLHLLNLTHTPFDTRLQMAAFVHALKVWPDEAAATETTSERKLSVLSYFPVDLPDEEHPYPPAYATFGGIIEGCDLLTNPITGLKFWWAQARTLIGQLELVADPRDLPPDDIQAGNAFWGNFYLSGLIKESSEI